MNENLANHTDTIKKSGKSRRGFASMDKDRHRLVSSKGGKSARTNDGSRLTPTPDVTTTPLN